VERGNLRQSLPFLARDTGIPKDTSEQPHTDIALMGIGQDDSLSIPTHEFVLPARMWAATTQFPEEANQVASFDGGNRWHLDGRFRVDIDIDSVNHRDRVVPCQAEK
jgi:hypothetical protein